MPLVETVMKRAVASPQLATWWAPSRPRGEGEDVAGLELAPLAVGAHARTPHEHDEQLFLGEVVVVGVGRLAGLDLPDARAEALGLELPADARALRAEARDGRAAGRTPARRCWAWHRLRDSAARSSAPHRTLRDSGKSFYSAGDDASSPSRFCAACCRASPPSPWSVSCSPDAAARARPAARAGAAGTDGRAAQAFPATTVAFVDANIDDQSDAWKRLLALGARFPSFPKLVAEFDRSANEATGNGPTLSQVRSWLGSEVAVGVLDVPAAGTDPDGARLRRGARSRAASRRALTKEKDTTVARHARRLRPLPVDATDSAVIAISADTALIGSTQAIVDAAIERLAGSGDKLADTSDFKDTLASLPSDNIAVGLRARRGAAEARGARAEEGSDARTRSRSRARR